MNKPPISQVRPIWRAVLNSYAVLDHGWVQICVGDFKLRVSLFNRFAEVGQLYLKVPNHPFWLRLVKSFFRVATQGNLQSSNIIMAVHHETGKMVLMGLPRCSQCWTHHFGVPPWEKPSHSSKFDRLANIWEGLQNCLQAWRPLSGWRRFAQ